MPSRRSSARAVELVGASAQVTLGAGHRHDAPVAPVLVEARPAARLLAAYAAYDSDPLRRLLSARGRLPVIPNNPTRKSG